MHIRSNFIRKNATGRKIKFKISEREVTIPGLEIIQAGEGTIRAGEGTNRAGQNFYCRLVLQLIFKCKNFIKINLVVFVRKIIYLK